MIAGSRVDGYQTQIDYVALATVLIDTYFKPYIPFFNLFSSRNFLMSPRFSFEITFVSSVQIL